MTRSYFLELLQFRLKLQELASDVVHLLNQSFFTKTVKHKQRGHHHSRDRCMLKLLIYRKHPRQFIFKVKKMNQQLSI